MSLAMPLTELFLIKIFFMTIRKSEVVWSIQANESDTADSFHCYYSKERINNNGYIGEEAHLGNAALCNKNFGVSEDGLGFLPIEKILPSPFVEKSVCKKCLKIYNKLT